MTLVRLSDIAVIKVFPLRSREEEVWTFPWHILIGNCSVFLPLKKVETGSLKATFF